MILDLFDGLLILLSLILGGNCTWSIICHLIAKNTFRTQEFHRSRKVTGIRRYILYMLQEAQLGLCGELVHHPHPFINHYPTGSCRYSLKFAMTHDRPLLSRRLPVRKTCNQQHCCQGQLELWKTISSNTYFSNLSSHMVSSGFQKDMNINTMHRTKHLVKWGQRHNGATEDITGTKHHYKEAYKRVHLQQRQVQNSRLQPYNKRRLQNRLSLSIAITKKDIADW